ncbi:MAG: CD225/dispanin family protein [Oscillospiraceae bacterium]|nr:CD225/dispanin family protein [Oscillospiraceae bacterium]
MTNLTKSDIILIKAKKVSEHTMNEQNQFAQQTYTYTDPGAGNAKTSLILGILGIVFAFIPLGVIGIVLSVKSNTKQRMAGYTPLNRARAGLITSIVATAYGFVFIPIAAMLAAIIIPLTVNHVENSRCSAAIADAKAAHDIVAEAIASAEYRGEVVGYGTVSETSCYFKDGARIMPDGHGIADVIALNDENGNLTAKHLSKSTHVYPSENGRQPGCKNCERGA